jgi:hypothetical protein
MRVLVIVLSATLTACASKPVEYSQTELALIKAQAETPTLMIDCPNGCSFQYRDPDAKVVMPERPTNGWDAMVNATNVVGGIAQTLAVPAAMGYVAVEGFKALKGSGAVTTTTTNTSNNTETTTSNNTETLTETVTTNTDNSVGDNSGYNSGNQGKIVTENSGMVDAQIDETSTPTVVVPPAP